MGDDSGVFLMPPLRAGLDTLARAFGDVLYVEALSGGVGCPGCGSQRPVDARDGAKPVVVCAGCGLCLPIEDWRPELGWAGFLAQELLSHPDCPSLYLPGPWNPEPWVTRAALACRYEAFRNERKSHVGY